MSVHCIILSAFDSIDVPFHLHFAMSSGSMWSMMHAQNYKFKHTVIQCTNAHVYIVSQSTAHTQNLHAHKYTLQYMWSRPLRVFSCSVHPAAPEWTPAGAKERVAHTYIAHCE